MNCALETTTNDNICIKENVKTERNYGIDLLRIIAMFFVVILHCLGQGGLLYNTDLNSMQYKFVWFIEIFAYCAVDIFALISGYVCYRNKEKKIDFSNYINLWLQVVFYGIFVTVIFNIFIPQIISINDYIIVLFPLTNKLYWYFSAYTVLFLIMPLLNKIIRYISEKYLKIIFFIIIIFVPLLDIIYKNSILANGYSASWIIILYILGASIKKYNIGKKIKYFQSLFFIGILYLITYLYKIYGLEISILNINLTKDLLISYTSPTVLLISILYLITFSKINLGTTLKNIAKFIAPSAFSIYLLNNQRLVWFHIMQNLFVNLSNQSLIKIFFYVIGFSVVFSYVAILTDKIRIIIINFLRKKCLNFKF